MDIVYWKYMHLYIIYQCQLIVSLVRGCLHSLICGNRDMVSHDRDLCFGCLGRWAKSWRCVLGY